MTEAGVSVTMETHAGERAGADTPPSRYAIPSPHDGEVGRGLGRGDSKERDNSMERAPLPPPSPRSCLAGRGSRRLQRWWVYQDAPPLFRSAEFPLPWWNLHIRINR